MLTQAETILRYRAQFPSEDRESFAAYRAMVSPMFEVTVPPEAAAEPFSAEFDTFVLGGVIVSKGAATPLRFERNHAVIARGGLDNVVVALYERGAHRINTDGTERRVEPGQIVSLDLTRPVRIVADGFANLSLTIARPLFEARFADPGQVHGAILRDTYVTRLFAAHLRALGNPARAIAQAEADQIASVTLDLLSSCLHNWAGRQHEPAQGTVALSAIRAAIEKRLADPALAPAALIQEFGISRPTLYRMFERYGGIAAYITDRRLRRAFRLLTDPARSAPKPSEVAAQVGFGSANAFGRAFRAMFGMTPREVRAMAWRPTDPSDSPWTVPEIARRFVAPLEPAKRQLVDRFLFGPVSDEDGTLAEPQRTLGRRSTSSDRRARERQPERQS